MAQPEQVPVILQPGYIQGCHGYLERKSSILKRWKKRWITVEPGKLMFARVKGAIWHMYVKYLTEKQL